MATFTVDGVIDWYGEPHLGGHTLVKVHSPKQCAGRACVIHAPSEHAMRDFPLIWNMPEAQMERLCPHDCTHPDPDDLLYWVEVGDLWKSLHDCCPEQCCTKEP